jgi:hypothetical protein
MYGRFAMNCFKYQVCGSDAITYLNAFLGGNRASTMSHQTAPIPHCRQPSPLSPLCMAA